MKNLFISTRSSITLLVIAGILVSCTGKKQQDKPVSDVIYTEAQAKEISFVTSGEIHFDDVIQVVFNHPVVGKDKVGSSPEGVLKFYPSIKGKAVWAENNVLKFIPDKALPGRTNYEGTLQLQKLSAKFLEQKIEDLIFRFQVLGRNVTNFKASLELKDRNDPQLVIYSGNMTFSEKTTLEAVKKAIRLKGGKHVTLTLNQIDSWNFQFSSSDIIRTNKDQEFTLSIDKKPLELEEDVTETFLLSPLKKMVANEFKTDDAGKRPRIRIGFSDELDMDQNIDGLVSTSPSTKVEVKKLGKTVILDGTFKFGQKYKITVQKGIRSRWGSKTEVAVTKEVQFSNIQPQVEFASDGIILPTSNNKKIQFYTSNLKRVHLQVKKVFPNQIGRFLQAEKLSSSKTRNKPFSENYESNVGVIVKSKTIELGKRANEWLLHEFDLSGLFNKYDDGLFLIRINFTPEDVQVPIEKEVLNYIVEKGQIYKPVFLSNLGLTVKAARDLTYVFVTDIITGQPKGSVKVTLLDYEGEKVSVNVTNNQGLATFNSNRYFNYVMVEDGKQLSALNRDEMLWSNSGFDIGGIQEERNKTKGFIYTERGVYRPGDSIHVGFIVKNEGFTFPLNHPVSIEVRDPEYNIVYTRTSVKSTDGYYVFGFKTDEKAATGNYNITIKAGGSWFNKDLKIETVVAEQLRVTVKPQKRQFVCTDKTVGFDINASYLFGAPAANLSAEVNVEVHPWEITFPKYAEFTFTRADIDFKPITQNVLKSELDDKGDLHGMWNVAALGSVPSALKLKISAKVLDKGGQPNEGWNNVSLHVYPHYVGLKDASGYGYYQTNQVVKFPVVLLDVNGNKVSGRQLQYRIYRNDKMWWYQYESRNLYRLKYKEDNQTYLESEGVVNTHGGTDYVSFTPAENGEYLVEVSDGGNGHTASMFFSAYQYGGSAGGNENEGTLMLKSDKAKYAPNEVARIKLPNPKMGRILVTLEKGNELLNWFWVDPTNNKANELVIDIPIKKSMLPNVYVTVSVLQPHAQTVNDRPIRMFGILPLLVEDPGSQLLYKLVTPESLAPNKNFTIHISTQNLRRSQFTIAVVDEGLLSLTQFRTPQPWKEFYQKVGLFVESFDVFSHVISANKGGVFQTFSIGGSDDMSYRESQTDPVDGKKRYDPVCLFKGPLYTDNQGNAKVTFRMPNYNGAVRVMVVGADGECFGNAEKTVPVRTDIIMQPSIPRMLHPGDEFLLPVSLFTYNKKIKSAQFTLSTEGPLEVIGARTYSVDFSQKTDAVIRYKVRVKAAVGQGKITIDGKSGTIQEQIKTFVKVVPSEARVYDKRTQQVEKGQSISIQVPKVGIGGTNRATLEVCVFPNMDFDHRLKELIDYPYGCLEQTTSTLFPQLSLKKMGYFKENERMEIDKNINEGIYSFQQFQLPEGNFSYWPGELSSTDWGTNYATHFLVEAKKMGYSVPDFIYDKALNGMKNAALRHTGDRATRVNRTLILALAGKTSMSEMNMLMENELDILSSSERWMLATAYYLAGAEDVSKRLLSNAGTKTVDYNPFSDNFGSKYRDDAIILYCATLMKKMETADLMAKQVALKLSSKEYLSTQSAGYMLLALSNYFSAKGLTGANGQILAGTITLANGKSIEFKEKGRFSLRINDQIGQSIQFKLSGTSSVNKAYVTLSWNGIPFKDEQEAYQKNLKLDVGWYDENGNVLDPQSLKQGTTLYGKFSVKNTSPVSELTDMALVQLLPSGWAIENTRLNNSLLPSWVRSWNINKEEYLDLRDDRVMWFFDLKGNETLDFVVKINCVNAGDFWLPATHAEAMYNNDYKAKTKGRKVHVQSFN